MNRHLLIISLLTCTIITAELPAQEDWKLAKSKNGIDVYLRKTPESPIKEFRVETLIKAPIGKVVGELGAIRAHPQWMEGVEEAQQIINPAGSSDSLLHYMIDMPFPFGDRDIVLHKSSGYSDDGTAFHIALTGRNDLVPECEDYTRMLFARGRYDLKSNKNGGTHVTYQFVSDPGGSIPNWLANAFIVNNPYKTMRNLRERLEHGG